MRDVIVPTYNTRSPFLVLVVAACSIPSAGCLIGYDAALQAELGGPDAAAEGPALAEASQPDRRIAGSAPQPLAAYHFDGDLSDSSGNGLDGEPSQSLRYTKGLHGQALRFSGDDSYAALDALAPVFHDHLDTFSLVVRARLRATPVFGQEIPIATLITDTGFDFTALRLALVGAFFAVVGDSGFFGIDSALLLGRAPRLDEWFQLALVTDGVRLRAYYNGAQVYAGDHIDLTGVTATHFYVGGRPGQSAGLNGDVDELLLFGEALTTEQLADL